MKTIVIQIHQDPRSKRIARFVNTLISLPEIKKLRIDKGPTSQRYVNIGIPTKRVRKTWRELRGKIRSDRILSKNSIVVCEGKHGWNDYELIYHWDVDVIDKKWRTA